MKKQVVILNNLISYQFYPGSTNCSIVFLHGWLSQGDVWSRVADLLAEAGFGGNVYCLDLPGFGGSSLTNDQYNLDDYKHVVEEFISKSGLDHVILVGHSFGGRVGIKLAAEGSKYIDKLVLVDSAGLILKSRKIKLFKGVAKGLKPLFYPGFMKGLRKKIYEKIGSDYLLSPKLKQVYIKTIEEDLGPILPKIEIPTLLIWGAKDKDTPLEIAQRMNKGIADSSLKIFEDAGHFSFIDEPRKFTAELLKFIG